MWERRASWLVVKTARRDRLRGFATASDGYSLIRRPESAQGRPEPISVDLSGSQKFIAPPRGPTPRNPPKIPIIEIIGK
jgi:hypothetical protein